MATVGYENKAPQEKAANRQTAPRTPTGGYRKQRIPWAWIVGGTVALLLIFSLVESKLRTVEPLPEGLIQANGRIEGDHVIVSCKFPGRLAELHAREGDTVAQGQILMEVSDPQTEARRDQAAANLASSIAQAQGSSSSVDLTRETGSAVIMQAQGQVAQAKALSMTLVMLALTALSVYGVLQGVFHVPIRGSLPLFFFMTVVYGFTTAGIGFLIATISPNSAQAGMLTLLIVMPMILLSGTWTPLDSMPLAVQWLTNLSPMRHFIEISYGILLRGATFWNVLGPFIWMVGLGVGLFSISLWRFRRQFE